MQQSNAFSRRTFARLVGVGAAAAALPIQLVAKPPAPAGEVRLSSNENPYGPSPQAMQAVRDSLQLAWRYPDEAADALVESVAQLHGVSQDQVILGAGSSEILKVTASAFLDHSRKLVVADPTFEAMGFYASANGANIVKVPLDRSFGHDVPRMIDAAKGAGVVYVCNPNNPTATITPKGTLRQFLDAVSVPVLVDEAYFHYAESSDYESVAPLIASKPNLIVARTFSKVYAMAGLRCGYALAQHEMIQKLAAQQAWNAINLLAAVAATASLGDTAHVAASRKHNHDTRAFVLGEIGKLGYRALPSEANFMMIDMREDVKPLIAKFREQGVRVGRLFPAMPQHLRVTIGTMDEMRRFANAFRALPGLSLIGDSAPRRAPSDPTDRDG